MSLNSALVDRARLVQKTSTGVRTEGTTHMTEVAQPWFKARLTLPGTSGDRPDSSQGDRRRVLRTPSLMCAFLDEFGEPVEMRADVRVEVESVELGTQMWRINGPAAPIRKKRRVIGWEAQLEVVEENVRELV